MPCPPASIYYAHHMGGVDLVDLRVALYALNMRHRKWWFPCFIFYLNMVMGNIQVIYKMLTGIEISGKDLRIKMSKVLIGNSLYRAILGVLCFD